MSLKCKLMMGVIPGYGHDNKELTTSNAYNVGKEDWEEAVREVMEMNMDADNPESRTYDEVGGTIRPASAIYSKNKNFGCPVGGEVGFQFESENDLDISNDEYKTTIQEVTKIAMKKLGQNTVTIEWDEDGVASSTYISNGGEDITNNTADKGIISFKTELGNLPNGEISDDEFIRVGSALQDALEKVSETPYRNDSNYYMISGITTSTDSGIEYHASQNPFYGQTDAELYKKSVEKTIAEAMKTLDEKNAKIEFSDGTVVELDLDDILRKENESKGEIPEK